MPQILFSGIHVSRKDLAKWFKEVYRVVKSGGRFMVCNESSQIRRMEMRLKEKGAVFQYQVLVYEHGKETMFEVGRHNVPGERATDSFGLETVW